MIRVCDICDLQRAFDEGYEKGRSERAQGNDLIRREDAINVVGEIETMRLKGQIDLTYAPTIKRLKSIPSADRPQGKWKAKSFHEFFCHNCGFSFDVMKCEFLENMKYCPNCGVPKGADDDL